MNTKRWHVEIEATGIPSVFGELDELYDDDFEDFIELGPDWTIPGYKITITYNDPYNLREKAAP